MAERVRPGIEGLGGAAEVKGGGRIRHEAGNLHVYGYSVGFGRADHTITVGVLKDFYPDYSEITFSNEGY